MDFHSLKRKQLQSLCKKHGIPANKTNLQMADLLTAALALKEKDNSIPQEDRTEKNSEDEQKNFKKVRFSPDVETREYEPSGYKRLGNRRGRGNGKTGSVSRTCRPQAKVDKEVSSVTGSDGVENVDCGEARMVGRRSTRTGAKFQDSDLVNIGVVNRNTRSKAQSVVSISSIERNDEVSGAPVKKSSKGIARATSKQNSVVHLDVPVESRQVVLKESRKRQKVMNLDVVTEDKASSETNEQNEKAPPPAANPRVARRKTIVLNPNNVAEESASDEAMEKLNPSHEKATREENHVVKELRKSNRRASVYGENEKALPPASNLPVARRKSIALNPNNVAEELASDEAMEKLKPLHEKATRKENSVVKELRRSNRRASVYSGATMSTEVNKIAGKVAQVKEISQSVQKAETTTVVSESLFAKPSRISSRLAAKGIARAASKRKSVVHLDVPVESREVVLKESRKRQKVMNLDVVTEDKASSETIRADTEDMADGANKRSNKMQKNHVEKDRVNGIEGSGYVESTDEVQLEMEAPNTKESIQADCKTFLHFKKDNIQAAENKETVAFGGNACDASELTGSNQAELGDGKGLFEFVREEKDTNRGQHDFASGEALTFPPILLLSSSSKWAVHKQAESSSCADSYCGRPEMELLHSPKQPNGKASYEEFDGEMEEHEIIMRVDERVQISDKGANNPTDNPSLGNDAKDHGEVAIEQINAHSDAFSEGVCIDDDGVLELSRENKTEIQPMEARREQCLSELGDEVVTVANSKPTTDTKNLDAISPFKESETFELNLFLEEGESTVEKAYPVNLGSFAETSSTKSNLKEGYTANFIVEELQVTEQFEEMKKTEAVMVDESHAITAYAVHQDSEFTAEVERTIEEDGVISGVERNKQDGRVDEEEHGQLGQEDHHRKASLVVGAETIMADTQDLSDGANEYPNKMQRNHVENYRFSDLERTEHDESTDQVQLEVEAANTKDCFKNFASSEALSYNPSLGDDARDHDEGANEQLNVHSDALSEEIFIDNNGFPNELSCENKTVIQPIEAGREQCLTDAVSPFKGKASDEVGDSSCHGSEAFEPNFFFEGGDYVVEKQAVETSPVNLVSMDAGSFQEHASSTLIAEEASDLKGGHTANFIVEDLQEVTEQFEEIVKTEAVMINQALAFTATATHQAAEGKSVELELKTSAHPENYKHNIHSESLSTPQKVDQSHALTASAVHQNSEFTAEVERTIEEDGVISGVERNKQDGRADEEEHGQLGQEAHHRKTSLVVGAATIMADTQDMSYGDNETTKFSFNGEENDVPEEKQADANDVPEEKQAGALSQFFMDELEDRKLSCIAVAKNTGDEICEKDVGDGMGMICDIEVGDSDVGEPLLSEATDAPSFLELPSYQLNSHVESTFFTNREEKDLSDGNLTNNNLEEAMHVEQNREESELALEDNLKSTDKPAYNGAPGDISTINQEFVDLENGKDNIAADSSFPAYGMVLVDSYTLNPGQNDSLDQSIAIYGPDIVKEQANISHCGDQGISENEVCEKHKDSRVATGKINVLQEDATYEAFDGQLEDEIIRADDGRVHESDEVANNPTDNPNLGDDVRDHDKVANEQHNVHSDALSEDVFILNELSCENNTEIQPTESGREQCLPELGDRVLTAANSEQMVDTKNLDAAVSPFKGNSAEATVDSSCHETEAFGLNLFFEEGEHVVEKQGVEAFPVNLVSMDCGSFPENASSMLIDEAERGYTANSIVEVVQEVTEQFEEMQKTEAVMIDQPHLSAVSAVHQEVTAEEGKSCELELQSANQTSDHTENDKHSVHCESLSFSVMKRTSRSDLISSTPQKFADPCAMKENAPGFKMDQRTSLTASRMPQKRRPLEDLRN